MAQKTPLYAEHVALGGKMTDFAGWEMPLYYGSQIEEHNHVRQDAGMFDVSHMTVLDIEGEDAKKFLRYLFANDIEKLTPRAMGAALYSCMLNEKGGVIDDLIVYRKNERDYRVVVNAATHDKDVAWFQKQAQKFNVKVIERRDLAMVAIQGPKARELTHLALSVDKSAKAKELKVFHGVEVGSWWIGRTGYTGEDGYEIMLPEKEAVDFWKALLKVGVKPCGLVCRDSLRLEAGMSLYGSEMDEEVSPLEANLNWTIAWEPKERDFIGRAPLEAKQKNLQNILVGIVLDERGVLRSHQKVIVPNVGEGMTTSGGFSPTLGHAVALARVPAGTKQGMPCQVIVRDKPLNGHVVKYPFVRNGKKVFE